MAAATPAAAAPLAIYIESTLSNSKIARQMEQCQKLNKYILKARQPDACRPRDPTIQLGIEVMNESNVVVPGSH